MAEHIIPVPPDGVFQWVLRREFDTAFHRLRFWWNFRVGAWFLNIANGENIVQVYGIRLGTGTDKLRAFKARDVPQGTLNVVDSTGTGTQPTLENFGRTVIIKYIDAPEETTTLIARERPATLPAPTPPAGVDPHAEEHEDGGNDTLELDKIPTGTTPAVGSVLTYSGGNTASWQLPTVPAHEAQHRLTGSDSIIVETLKTGESDTAKVLNPDGASGVGWNASLADLPSVNLFDHASGGDTSTTYTTIEFTDVRPATPDAAFFTVISDDAINIETAGRYLVTANGYFAPSSPGPGDVTLGQMRLYKNGSITGLLGADSSQGVREDATDFGQLVFSVVLSFAVDDVLTLRMRHNAASDVPAIMQADTYSFTLVYLGP